MSVDFDFRTLAFASSVLPLLYAVGLAAVALSGVERLALRLLAMALLCNAFGTGTLFVWASQFRRALAIANALTVVELCITIAGVAILCRRVERRDWRRWVGRAVVIGLILGAVLGVASLQIDEPRWRQLVIGVFYASLSIFGGWLLLKTEDSLIRIPARVTSMFFFLYAGWFVSRAVIAMTAAEVTDLRSSGLRLMLLFLLINLVVIGKAFGFVWIACQRLASQYGEALRVKNNFLATVGHEFRTPLHAVSGYLQLLRMDEATLSNIHRDYLTELERSTALLTTQIEDVLTLSRLDVDGVKIDLRPCQPATIMKSVLGVLEISAKNVGVSLVLVPPPDDIPDVLADPIRLTQVLVNLGSNAIKYNRAGGIVTFRVSAPEPDIVRFSVDDSGPGIPQSLQSRLFVPFDRLGAEHGPISGTGIGLTVARNLTLSMGGTLGFSSVERQGSSFWVDMPFAR